MKIRYQSLRKISKYFEIFSWNSNISPNNKGIGQTNHEETKNEELEYSGHNLYDKRFLRLNVVKHYRLTLFDAVLSVPISKRIVRRRIPKKIPRNLS